MRCKSQGLKRTAAILFLLCFVAAALLSHAFIITHADHEHDHAGPHGQCSACVQIQWAENLLNQLGIAVVCPGFAFGGMPAAVTRILAALRAVVITTPVALKTRMNY